MQGGGAMAPYRTQLPHTRIRSYRSRAAIRPRRGPLVALATRTTFVINAFETASRLWRNRGAFQPESRLARLGDKLLRKSNNMAPQPCLSDALQALARGVKLNEPRLERLKPVLVFGDDVFRRPGDEVGVAELRLDLGDFLPLPRDLLVEPRPFGSE